MHSPRSSRSSSSSFADDIDAITPCPATAAATLATESERDAVTADAATTPRSTTPDSEKQGRRRDSVRVLEEGTDGDPESLWRRMLALQEMYGCYNSARMSAALSSGDIRLLLPSKACLNLLNDNMTELPDDAERAIRHPSFAGWFRRKARN